MNDMTGKLPYTITEKAADYLAKIVEISTRLSIGSGFPLNIRLHRENRLRTIHSSLAIEGNSLSLGEMTAVIEGKMVAGKQEDVKEVRNAYEAYDRMMTFSPYAISDFLKAHKLVTQGLVKEAGKFRSGDVGVFNGDVAVHMGARPQFVPSLMNELFRWARTSELHPVLKSAVLHYEIETIHPFADGKRADGALVADAAAREVESHLRLDTDGGCTVPESEPVLSGHRKGKKGQRFRGVHRVHPSFLVPNAGAAGIDAKWSCGRKSGQSSRQAPRRAPRKAPR